MHTFSSARSHTGNAVSRQKKGQADLGWGGLVGLWGMGAGGLWGLVVLVSAEGGGSEDSK